MQLVNKTSKIVLNILNTGGGGITAPLAQAFSYLKTNLKLKTT